MRPSIDAITMMMQMDSMTATDSHDTVKSTTSIMDDPYAHVLDYKLH